MRKFSLFLLRKILFSKILTISEITRAEERTTENSHVELHTCRIYWFYRCYTRAPYMPDKPFAEGSDRYTAVFVHTAFLHSVRSKTVRAFHVTIILFSTECAIRCETGSQRAFDFFALTSAIEKWNRITTCGKNEGRFENSLRWTGASKSCCNNNNRTEDVCGNASFTNGSADAI